MVKIRLQRAGRKKRPQYRVVVAEHTSPRDGRYIENIGLYFPQEPTDKQVRLDVDRVKHWLSVGAQPSPTVRGLLHRIGMFEGKAPSRGKPDQPNKKAEAARVKAEAAAKREAEEKAAAEAKAAAQAEAEAAAKAEAEAAAKAEAEAAAKAEAEAAAKAKAEADAAVASAEAPAEATPADASAEAKPEDSAEAAVEAPPEETPSEEAAGD